MSEARPIRSRWQARCGTKCTKSIPICPPSNIHTVDQILAESLPPERFRTWLLTAFGIAAILLATLGIAGLPAYNAAQRMQEFGIRVALEADRRNLFGLVLRRSLRLSVTGIGLEVVASLVTTRALSALLYDTSPFDPATKGSRRTDQSRHLLSTFL